MYLFNGEDEATFKAQLQARAALRASRVSEVAGLDKRQREKLNWALQGDLNRFFRDMEAARRKTEGLNLQNQNEMQAAWQHIAPLHQKITTQGVLGDDSLFEKVLATSLEPQQSEKLETYLQSRAGAELSAIIRVTLAELEKSIPLLQSQRNRLIELIQKQDLPKSIQPGMEVMAGFYVLSKLKEGDISAILDEKQCVAFTKMQKQYAGFRFGAVAW